MEGPIDDKVNFPKDRPQQDEPGQETPHHHVLIKPGGEIYARGYERGIRDMILALWATAVIMIVAFVLVKPYGSN